MKSKIMFFLLLITGSLSGSECSNISCVELAKQEACDAGCRISDSRNRGNCKRQCTQRSLGPNITAGIQLKQVGNVSLDCYVPSRNTTDIRITFNTVRDKCYSYRVTCERINGTYIPNQTTITNTIAPRGAAIFRRLPLGSHFRVSVQSIVGNIVGNKTTIPFRTPLPEQNSSYPKICVPPKVKDLRANAIPTKANTFNVTVHWARPSSDTESLTLTLKTDQNHIRNRLVSASNSGFTFKDVPILRKYKVSAKASSWAGTGKTDSKEFKVSEGKTNQKPVQSPGVIDINLNGSTAAIILGVLIGFGCAMAVTWFVYRQRKNRAERKKDSEGGSVADEDDYEEGASEKEDDWKTPSLKHT